MEQCIEQLPSSPQPSDADDVIEDSPLTAGMFGLEEQVSLLHFHTANETEKPNFLGALDLPALPSPKPGRRPKKHLGRSDIARLRGVDPVDAPEELRCAIDGKLMAVPLVSPHGHVFEHETLLQWLSSCGSICPITGKPLREEDCEPAVEIQQKVLDWVKAARSSYKRRLEEKRRRRLSQEATTEIPQNAD
ncbi:PUB12 [Symbiodinium sp. CCMP2592]|nr:PUB12 [Symbiodinium sp. CCMP2592]